MSSAAADRHLPALALASLGVVFGDIGTSPLYALHVCFMPGSGVPPSADNVLGVLSLVFWALILIISIKYMVFVMRADLHGEGGILALMALATGVATSAARRRVLVALGLFGAALLYGDSMLTPAISVLSAIEGLKVAAPLLEPLVRVLAVAVLIGLFCLQPRGTGTVGALFGPVMVMWFVVLVVLGLRWIVAAPEVLAAVHPLYAVRFLAAGGHAGFLLLGSVFLAVTGGEALYADIGHFGTRPIRLTWFGLVLPAVLINYFGQGAMLLRDPDAAHHTFFRLAPAWAIYPLVGLATAAAVIASQAVISGAFSLTSQAVQLGYSPRVAVVHSSEEAAGQVYAPVVNWLLLAAAVGLVLAFKGSDALAGAYGLAVSGTMVLTTALAFAYFRRTWGTAPALLLAAVFVPIEIAFVAANLAKVDRGGWFPLLIGAVGYLVFRTWTEGQQHASAGVTRLIEGNVVQDVLAATPLRAPGTAVFLSREQGLPHTLQLNLARNHVLHERVIILTVRIEPLPRVASAARSAVTNYLGGFVGVIVHYGYLELPNIPAVLRDLDIEGGPLDLDNTTFFLARLRIIPTARPGMRRWRKRLYAFLVRNAQIATASYQIPAERVFEIGIPVEL